MQAGVSVPHYQGMAGELQPLPVLIITSVALLVTGVVMISSASMDMAAATLGNSYHYVIRQILFAGLGCATALVAVAEGGGGDHDIGKVARLDIGERINLPIAARDEANTGVLPFVRGVRALEPQRPVVLKDRGAELQFGRHGERRDRA